MEDMPYEWLTSPVLLHSSRDHECTMTAEQCTFKYRHWVNWYLADLVYGHAAVYFFVAAIGVFIAANAFVRLLPAQAQKGSRAWLKGLAAVRSLSYPDRLILGWRSPSLGVCMLLGSGFVYFSGVSLGPKPYYWPNTDTVSYGDSPPLATRSGYLSLACLPFIFAFGAKANLVTAATGIAPEKLIVFHLFAAWGMFVLALMHTFPFVVYHTKAGDIVENWNASAMWLTGVIALVAQAWLTFASLPFVRHRAYEFFKFFHLLAAAIFVVFLFIHVDYTLTSWDYIIATGAIYLSSLAWAIGRTYIAHGLLRAHLVLESDQTVKITVPATTRLPLTWRPGQHVYLRFMAFGLHALTAHPFTICSIPSNTQDKQSSLVFYAKPRGGITGRLASLARKQPGVIVPVFIEGPYGGVARRWDAGFDKTVVVAGGAGAGFSLGLVEDWLCRAKARIDNKATLQVIVSSRDPGMRRWYVETVNQLAEKHASTGQLHNVHIALHETGPAGQLRGSAESERGLAQSMSQSLSPSLSQAHEAGAEGAPYSPDLSENSHGHSEKVIEKEENEQARTHAIDITYKHGQADLPQIIKELSMAASCVGVVVCGPSSMAHDVATACGAEQLRILKGGEGAVEVWLHQEAFTN